jgi:UDP-N-acetylglucosamine--N-acetylmuramyl-(pentapeptide) pyrophosphoryl-undecaprenol N-acetylglucosamine transferase
VRELYAELRVRARVEPFIDDMPAALAAADLVIGRAGAGAVAEICAVGRPSLLVPYPFAGDHQRFNAASLVARGAALCVLTKEATLERLQAELVRLDADHDALRRMAAAARALGRPAAATAVAEDLLVLAGLARKSGGGSATAPSAKSDGGRTAAAREAL